ncbi:MAG: NAD(P)-binding domain-containing protein [Bacteroidota bacterium]
MKKIGIIGSGIVAQTLGEGFIKHGYSVMLGSRDQGKLAEWKSSKGKDAELGTFEEAAAFGELLVLSIKGSVAVDVLNSIEVKHLTGKTIMDATNPIADGSPENGVLPFFTDQNGSLMETLQNSFPDTHFVKAFNSVGSHLMVNPSFDTKPTMFICGNHEESKKEVTAIVTLFGWEVEDMGTAEAARAIEPLCILWCIPGFLEGKWSHAFKLLK